MSVKLCLSRIYVIKMIMERTVLCSEVFKKVQTLLTIMHRIFISDLSTASQYYKLKML